ncbi:hypothetical protein [Rossellomorea marisflavi]|uniref:hypothetical protein n=1 Tax=Rossellomorea marisflavi TaxID=189381 RepID=UPI003D2EA84E
MVRVKVTEHDGTTTYTELEEWNAAVAKEIHQEIREAQGHDSADYTVVIGDVIVDARSVKSITKTDN